MALNSTLILCRLIDNELNQKKELSHINDVNNFDVSYSLNERTEVWRNVQKNKVSARIIVGARSSIFLPFKQY